MSTERASPRHRVAIVGAGPAGFYAAAALLKEEQVQFDIDFIDKLHAPFGLLRYGVAPDHQKIKRLRAVFERTLNEPNVHFIGDVKLGREVSREDLVANYDHVIYATGSQGDRMLGVPGEDLDGVLSATEFVAWYNGHPEYRDLDPHLQSETAVIIGAGNVALDVARVLAKSVEELATTDIADHALAALADSNVRDIYVLARRGPAHAKFSNPELKEFGELTNARATVMLRDFDIDELTQKELEEDRIRRRNVEIMQEFADMTEERDRRVHFRFLTSLEKAEGTGGKVGSATLVRNRTFRDDSGKLKLEQTEVTESIDTGLIIRAIGYLGTAIPGLPFDKDRGVLPSLEGRMLVAPGGKPTPTEYVVGWAKRGATGVIGTNKPDAEETAASLISDARERLVSTERTGIMPLLDEREIPYVTTEHWKELDALERQRGEETGRPRVKTLSAKELGLSS